MRVLISGGGTGGHVYPAIAIADAIKALQPDAEIRFVGARGKLEMEKVPAAGYPIEGLRIAGFQRRLTWRNLLFPLLLLSSLWQARRILRRFRPDVVVGVGGYASGPVGEWAARMGIPLLLQEQNSYPGVTNRLLGRKARCICVAYEGMERWFPAEKLLLTGNPVRAEIFQGLETKRPEAARVFGLDPGRKTLFVFGGSLGARTLNQALVAMAESLRQRPEVQVLWQCGRLYAREMEQSATAALPNVRLLPYVERMDLAYALADLVVARAGAITISELSLAGKAALLVPSPNVAEDHQTRNAEALVRNGAAVLLPDAAAERELGPRALQLLDEPETLERLQKNIRALARPDAAQRIAEQVLRLAHNAAAHAPGSH